MSIASQIPLQNFKPHFALNILPLHKSHSINKFAANALLKWDNKEWEKSEQLDPIVRIFDTNSNIHLKFFKLSANAQNSNYKYDQSKNTLFCPRQTQNSSVKYSLDKRNLQRATN